MPAPYNINLPEDLRLWDSCIVRVTALDPTTGAVVSGVTVSEVTIECDQLRGAPLGDVGNPLLIGINA